MKQKHKRLWKLAASLILSLTLTFASCPMSQVFAAANGRKRYVVIPKDGYFQTIRDRFFDRLSTEISTVLTAISGKLLTLELTAWEAFGLESIFGIAAVDEDIDVIACADETGGESAPEWNMQMIRADATEQTAFGYGTIDLAYALEVYDQLKDVEIAPSTPADTDALIEENGVTENPSTIETSENDYVEGRWWRDNHQDLVGNVEDEDNVFDGGNTSHIMLFECFKYGARINDTYIPGLEAFPELHGGAGYKDTNGTITNNYVFAYFLTIDLAQYLYTAYGESSAPAFALSNSATASTILGSNSNLTATSKSRAQRVYNSLTTRITKNGLLGIDGKQYSWSQVFAGNPKPDIESNEEENSSLSYAPTKARVCAVVYGMAAHIMADTFAHSSFVNGEHITHQTDNNNNKIKDADDPYYFSNRWNCATEAVRNVVFNYYNGTNNKRDGSISDYMLGSYDSSFKLWHINSYILQVSNGTASNNTLTPAQRTYFANMNYPAS